MPSAKDIITYSSIISCPMNAVRVYLVPWVWWQCILSQRVWWQCTLSQQSDDNVSCPMSGDSIYLLSHDCGDSVLSQECGDCVSCPMSVSCPMWRCCPVNVVKVYPVPRVWWQPLLTSRYQGRAFQTPSTDKQGSGACIPNPHYWQAGIRGVHSKPLTLSPHSASRCLFV